MFVNSSGPVDHLISGLDDVVFTGVGAVGFEIDDYEATVRILAGVVAEVGVADSVVGGFTGVDAGLDE